MLRPAALLSAVVLAGCNLAPRYQQPQAPIAASYPIAPVAPVATNATASELGWDIFFLDPQLRSLVALALERNRDLAISYARIAQARAQFRIAESQRLPTIDADAGGTRTRQPIGALGLGDAIPGGGGDSAAIESSQYSAAIGISGFELDLWGRVRNLAEGERQRYLASIEGARAFRLSLIGQVAAAYFDVRAGEERIALAERSLAGRREGVRIARLRLDSGVTSTIDHDQAVLLLTQAQTELADIQRITEQSRNLLELLVGGPIDRELPPRTSLAQQVRPIEPGLPSVLLAVRPDIRQAEHELRAANADIGAARAAFFPTISLTGSFGFASSALENLFKDRNRSWSFGGGIGLPIFDWGRRSADLRLSRARADELVASYQRTTQGAFREVADALIARRSFAEQIAAQTRTLEAQQRLARTARLRYENGIAIYLEVLDAERNLFSAEQQLIQLRAIELQNLVSLYVALGGGPEPAQP